MFAHILQCDASWLVGLITCLTDLTVLLFATRGKTYWKDCRKTVERLRGSSRIFEDRSRFCKGEIGWTSKFWEVLGCGHRPGHLLSASHQVGQALGRLDPLARQIGQTAERHRLRAEVQWNMAQPGTAWYRNISNVQLLTVMYTTEKHETWWDMVRHGETWWDMVRHGETGC